MKGEGASGPTLSGMGERGFIARLRREFPGLREAGDDAAVLPPLSCPVATIDSFVEGRHFHRWWCDPVILGRRLLEATLSDLAAMGAGPSSVLVSLAAPGDLGWGWLAGFYAGLLSRDDCTVAGGETVASDRLVVTISATGEGGDPSTLLRRSAMAPGDSLWLTGPLGRSLDIAEGMEACGGLAGASLEPVNPMPELELERFRAFLEPRAAFDEAGIIRSRGVRCAIDVSDGLFSEAMHLCRESGAGCEMDLAPVPLFEAVRDRPEEACAAGEDFVLLFSAPPSLDFSGHGFTRIGRATDDPGLRITRDGQPAGLPDKAGYDHFVNEKGRPRPFGRCGG